MDQSISGSIDQNLYVKCSSCGMINFDPQWKMSDINYPAPCCGASGSIRNIWPDIAVRKLVRIASEQDLDSQDGISTAVIFLCAAIDVIIYGVLEKLFASRYVGDGSLPYNYGKLNFVELYNDLCNQPLQEVLKEKHEYESLVDLEYLIDCRNRIVRKTGLAEDFDISKARRLLKRFFLGCYKLFSIIENDLLVQLKEADAGSEDHIPSILIVDDEEGVRFELAEYINKRGYKTYLAQTGREAVELYGQFKPNYVFLDVMLPDMDGLKVLEKIKEINNDANVYFVTGIDGISFKNEAKRLGSKGHFLKPVLLDEIVKVIK